MRRGGMFRAIADTQNLIPLDSETGQVLEAKWKQWIRQESFKRSVEELMLWCKSDLVLTHRGD